MNPFALEWRQAEKERHGRLLYQLKRELAEHRKSEVAQQNDSESRRPILKRQFAQR